MNTITDTLQMRLAEREKRRKYTAWLLLKWMEQYDYTEGPGILEILIEKGFIEVDAVINMTAHLKV